MIASGLFDLRLLKSRLNPPSLEQGSDEGNGVPSKVRSQGPSLVLLLSVVMSSFVPSFSS